MIERHPHPDVTLLLDGQGVIRRAEVSGVVFGEDLGAWLGRPWWDTVDSTGADSMREMVDEARVSGVSAYLELKQLFPSGRSLPIEYTAIRLGDDDDVLVVGRSLRAVAELQARLVEAQQTMERDYWKLREIESRYRLLFRSSTDAVVLLRADSLNVIELNPAAVSALGIAAQRSSSVVGRDLLPLLDAEDRGALRAMLGLVAQRGHAPGVVIHVEKTHGAWMAQASLLAAESGRIYLMRLTPDADDGASATLPGLPSAQDVLQRIPDGFVMTDRGGLILRVNQGCLDLMQMPSERSVLHETLGRWLDRPGADLEALLESVQRAGSVRLFATTLHGELGAETDVEISAIGDVSVEPEFISLIIRDVGQRLGHEEPPVKLTEHSGSLSAHHVKHALRALVEETVGVVERHYIEEALQLTGGNRTAAAELLGLSRQSLYVKLSRYGLETDSTKNDNGRD